MSEEAKKNGRGSDSLDELVGNKLWDSIKGEFIETPKDVAKFLTDIFEVCEKHRLSISHEDGHGSFIIQEFITENIEWLGKPSLSISND